MRSKPRQLSSEEQVYEYAVRALMRRAHSVYEMRQALERNAEDKTHVARVLARLKDKGYLDDAKYARQFARTRASGRTQGRFRIAQELRRRGVPDRHIEPALDEVFAETDERGLLRKRIERKLRTLRGPLDVRKRASLFASLLRAGFSADAIRRELRLLTRDDVPENEAPDENV